MKVENFNISSRKTRVLVAPLEWGLGHATRCVPIINDLIRLNCEVLIAAGDASKALLQLEFPHLTFLRLPCYRIRYSRNKYWLSVKILFQFPKILLSAFNEHSWLIKAITDHHLDAVISDNRFGLYHSALPCIYITHQLGIKTGIPFTEWAAQKLHYHFINKFIACWVPDSAGEINLAGELSHPKRLPKVPVHYIGPLSRFEKTDAGKKYDLAIILSGPEPQRSIFEDLLLKNLENYNGHCIFVRGLPGTTDNPLSVPSNTQIEIHDHLPSCELNNVLQQSSLIISRSGYTTVMDLIKLGKKAILVPTPGQTEQEYLSESLVKKKFFYCVSQCDFSLQEDLKKEGSFPYCSLAINQKEYKRVMEGFLTGLQRGLYNKNP